MIKHLKYLIINFQEKPYREITSPDKGALERRLKSKKDLKKKDDISGEKILQLKKKTEKIHKHLELSSLVGFNGEYIQMANWVPHTSEIIYACANNVVAYNGMLYSIINFYLIFNTIVFIL